jgi:hypothetical protein
MSMMRRKVINADRARLIGWLNSPAPDDAL